MTIVLIFFPYPPLKTQSEAAEIIIVSLFLATFCAEHHSYRTPVEHGKASFEDL
jgi:hypothetical protein